MTKGMEAESGMFSKEVATIQQRVGHATYISKQFAYRGLNMGDAAEFMKTMPAMLDLCSKIVSAHTDMSEQHSEIKWNIVDATNIGNAVTFEVEGELGDGSGAASERVTFYNDSGRWRLSGSSGWMSQAEVFRRWGISSHFVAGLYARDRIDAAKAKSDSMVDRPAFIEGVRAAMHDVLFECLPCDDPARHRLFRWLAKAMDTLGDSFWQSVITSPGWLQSFIEKAGEAVAADAIAGMRRQISAICAKHKMPRVPVAKQSRADVIRELRDQQQSGVYFFWEGNECIYVGKSKNIANRLGSHGWFPASGLTSWLPFPEERITASEMFYIWLLEPRENAGVGVPANLLDAISRGACAND